LRNNSWTSNKHNEKKNKKKRMNTEHGEENVQVSNWHTQNKIISLLVTQMKF